MVKPGEEDAGMPGWEDCKRMLYARPRRENEI